MPKQKKKLVLLSTVTELAYMTQLVGWHPDYIDLKGHRYEFFKIYFLWEM